MPDQRLDDFLGTHKVLSGAFSSRHLRGSLARMPTATDVLSTEVLVRVESELATTPGTLLCPLNDRLPAHGLTLAQVTSSRYRATQELSREIHDGHPEVDGGERVALLDRAADAIATIVVTGQPFTPELAGQFGECHLGL